MFISEVVTEKLVIADWAFDRSEYNFRSFSKCYVDCDARSSWPRVGKRPTPTTIIAHIRPGVHWHNKAPMNGRELTASDVEFNYHRLLRDRQRLHRSVGGTPPSCPRSNP